MINKKAISKLFVVTTFLLISLSFTLAINEPDPLHKRVFNTSLSETKNGVVAKKVISDKLYFKNGKVYSDFLYEKFGYRYISYRINKDTIYTDFTNTEVRQLEVEAVLTDSKNQSIFLNFTTSEWDIDGVIKITKNDKLKRYYDFAGREKGGKPKKKKKKTSESVVEIIY